MPAAKKRPPKPMAGSAENPAGPSNSAAAASWQAELSELTYNQARTALELALSQLQSEELEVEAMADLYRRAQAYAGRCEQVLEQVEQEITQLQITDLEQDS